MLTGYISPKETFVACPNQDVVYGAGFVALDKEPVVFLVPEFRSVSVIIPQARVLNFVQSLATGSFAFVGSAEAQAKISDSVTGQVRVAERPPAIRKTSTMRPEGYTS